MWERRALTVTELTLHLKRVIETDPLLGAVLVRGEVSNLRQPASGHMYFTLKDEGAALRCVMFRGSNQRLRFRLLDGLAAEVLGHVSVYPRDGQYQLYVEDVRPAGLGGLYLAFEQLKAKLAQEGLFDERLKRALPLLPRRVAVVTSPTGAALRDVLKVAERRCPGLKVVLVPVQVQGDEAALQIARALELAGDLEGVDVVILTRGGGSLEELWAFNEEAVARAVRACRLPVVVGVGHEIDVTIADLAADVRAPTPSAAAELVFPDCAALCAHLAGLAHRLRNGFLARAAALRRRLDGLASSPSLRRPKDLIATRAQVLDSLSQRLAASLCHLRDRLTLQLGQETGKLDALSPVAVLARGYAICTILPGGDVVRSARAVSVGAEVAVRLAAGGLRCLVQETLAETVKPARGGPGDREEEGT